MALPASLRARWAVGVLAAAAYAGGSHALMTRAGDSTLALLVLMGPLALMGLVALWQCGHKAVAAVGAVAAAGLAAAAVAGRGLSAPQLYLAQHAGVHAALALWFGATLRRGARPLISALAQRVHGGLTPSMAAYTRKLTAVWALYFLAMAAVSIALFVAGDFGRWSLFANVLTPVLTAAMFVVEYLLRYRLHPEFERVSLSAGFKAWQATGRPREAGQP